MNPRIFRIVSKTLVVLPLLLVITSSVNAQSTIGQRTLKGLDGLAVVIDVTNPEAEGFGLSTEQLKSSVESQLSKAGVKVLPISKMLEAKGKPQLYITINVQKSNSDMFAYSVSVRFKQGVMLTRVVGKSSTTMTEFTGTTWEQSDALGFVDAGKLQSIGSAVTGQVDNFIKDFLAVNK